MTKISIEDEDEALHIFTAYKIAKAMEFYEKSKRTKADYDKFVEKLCLKGDEIEKFLKKFFSMKNLKKRKNG